MDTLRVIDKNQLKDVGTFLGIKTNKLNYKNLESRKTST